MTAILGEISAFADGAKIADEIMDRIIKILNCIGLQLKNRKTIPLKTHLIAVLWSE